MKIQIDSQGNIIAWGSSIEGNGIKEADLPEKFQDNFSKYLWDGDAIVLKPGESVEEKQIGLALGAVLQATEEEKEQIRNLLGL